MSKPSLPDINVWLALSLQVHPHHGAALKWFEATHTATVNFCRYTQQGTLRLLTTAALVSPFGLKPLSNKAAIAAMTAMRADERITFSEEPLGVFDAWMRFADASSASPKLWMDAYLAAFALTGGYRLVTIDKAMKHFEAVDVLVLK